MPQLRSASRCPNAATTCARLIPIHTHPYPTITLPAKFASACQDDPSLAVSYSNVLNVVYAPINPMVINGRQLGCCRTRSARSVAMNPRSRLPVALITNVPHGKFELPNRSVTHVPTPNRATAPSAPPSAMSNIWIQFNIHVLPTLKRLLQRRR